MLHLPTAATVTLTRQLLNKRSIRKRKDLAHPFSLSNVFPFSVGCVVLTRTAFLSLWRAYFIIYWRTFLLLTTSLQDCISEREHFTLTFEGYLYKELGWWALLSYFKSLTLCLVNVGRHFGSLSFTGQASAYLLGCPPTLPSLMLPSLPLALCMLSAVAFARSCVCSGGCSPRCVWHLPFLFGKLSGIFLFQAPLTLAALFFVSMEFQKLFLWSWCCAGMLPCLLCHVLVPRNFTATFSGLPHLSLAKSSLARWPPQVTPSLFFMFPSLWASLVCSFMPPFSFKGLSVSIITYSHTFHSRLIILRLCHIRVQFECGAFASSNSASPCHLACLFF